MRLAVWDVRYTSHRGRHAWHGPPLWTYREDARRGKAEVDSDDRVAEKRLEKTDSRIEPDNVDSGLVRVFHASRP